MAADRRFPPTARKRSRLREQGDIPKSREITSLFLIVGGLGGGLLGSREIVRTLEKLFVWGFSGGKDFHTNNVIVSGAVLPGIGALLLPFLGATAGVLLGELGQVGWRFSAAGLLRWERILPAGRGGLAAARKNLLSTGRCLCVWASGVVVLAVLVFHSRRELAAIISGSRDPAGWWTELWLLSIRGAGWTAGIGAVGAVTDWFIARALWKRKHFMTLEEMKNELKESEGNPEIRMMRRAAHQEIAFHGELQAVRRSKMLLVRKARRSAPSTERNRKD